MIVADKIGSWKNYVKTKLIDGVSTPTTRAPIGVLYSGCPALQPPCGM